jgi:hypothetical protein
MANMIDDGSGNLVQQVLMLAQLSQQRNQQQGANQINTALPGQTAKDVGMTERQFKAIFGKDVAYNPGRVLREQKSSDILDNNLKNFLATADPATLASFSASAMLNRSGVAGLTTPEGLDATIKTGGRAAQTAEQVSSATQPEAVRTGVAHAKTAAVQAETAGATAESIAGLVAKGIQSMAKAPEAVQAAAGQTAAYGTTASAIESGEYKNQLGIASLRMAIDAQTNPRAPIHAFLAKNGLDLHTVMAGSAMGISSLFDNYSRMLMSVKATSKEMELALLRSRLESARDMSMKVFHGKLTPNQVMAVMDAKESGKPLPKGLEAAGQIYDYAVEASFQSAIAQEIEKGDPMITAMRDQIHALQAPGLDPNNLTAVRDLSRNIAAVAMTKTQIGDPPPTAEGQAKWDQVFQANKARVPGASIKFPLFSRGSSVGAEGLGSQVPPVMAPAGSTALPPGAVNPSQVKAIQNVPAAGGILAPVGGAAPTGQATNQPMSQLTPEDQKAVADYLKTIGVGP